MGRKYTNRVMALLAVILSFSSVAGCLGVDQTALDNLKQRTLNTLVFVEGGTFMMGDVGYTDENGQFHNFTNDADVFPVHQVTLTSYSIMAYEVTFEDFDFYTVLSYFQTLSAFCVLIILIFSGNIN